MPPNREQRERLKQYLKRVDDFVDPAVDFVELDDNRLAFWEAYFWGRVACHLHMRVGKGGSAARAISAPTSRCSAARPKSNSKPSTAPFSNWSPRVDTSTGVIKIGRASCRERV